MGFDCNSHQHQSLKKSKSNFIKNWQYPKKHKSHHSRNSEWWCFMVYLFPFSVKYDVWSDKINFGYLLSNENRPTRHLWTWVSVPCVRVLCLNSRTLLTRESSDRLDSLRCPITGRRAMPPMQYCRSLHPRYCSSCRLVRSAGSCS